MQVCFFRWVWEYYLSLALSLLDRPILRPLRTLFIYVFVRPVGSHFLAFLSFGGLGGGVCVFVVGLGTGLVFLFLYRCCCSSSCSFNFRPAAAVAAAAIFLAEIFVVVDEVR